MNTPGHIVMNLAFLGKKQKPEHILPLVLGGILPDIPIYIFYAYQKFVVGMPELFIWAVVYFLHEWQVVFDSFHSIPILLAGFFLASQSKRLTWFVPLFAGMLLHSLIDLPLHSEDAHRHFYPLSDFRFESPVSYWNPEHYGFIATVAEILAVIFASIYVLKWNKKKWVKIMLYAINFFYLVGSVVIYYYFNGMF